MNCARAVAIERTQAKGVIMDDDRTTTAVEKALVEKIEGLERHVAELQGRLQQAQASAMGAMLGPLRLRSTVLLYLGKEDMASYSERLARDFGTDAMDTIAQHLFDLNNVPLAAEGKEALRAAMNYGIQRW